ncbi:HD domain-containing protein [Aquibacillus sediminis]|uniref:HD domain-containing protein n=1 Tax=Aquibacillus sediminis TaxID=2574734 RepID=UPI001107CB8C|nr:HD domain-containing protein [Aquibacillus sediminis]
MNRKVTLENLFVHPIVQKYVGRSGMAHAIRVAEKAFHIAIKTNVNPDLAAKAGLLHDIGHYEWYQNGKWDYQQYKQNDIHAIKGSARAHKLLVRCGEDLQPAKEIALAVLLHTDSYLPEGDLQLTPLQNVVAQADHADEEPGGNHHYRRIDEATALSRIQKLDLKINQHLLSHDLEQTS